MSTAIGGLFPSDSSTGGRFREQSVSVADLADSGWTPRKERREDYFALAPPTSVSTA